MLRRTLIATLLLFALVPASPAMAAPDRTVETTAGSTQTWSGVTTPGTNLNYFNLTNTGDAVIPTGTCTKDPQTYCDITLLKLNNPVPAADLDGILRRTATVSVGNYGGPVGDVDMIIYASDANGTKGEEVGRSDALTTETESASFSVTTTTTQPTKYYLVHIVYFLSPGLGYSGTVQF